MEKEKEKEKETNPTLPQESLPAAEPSDMEIEKEKNPTLPHDSPSAAEPSDKEKEKKLTLPSKVLVKILLRLPVRSLRCFRKVSPLWSSLISNPQFAKSHFDLNAAPTHRLLLRFINEDRVQSFDLASSLDDRSAIKTLNLPSPSISCNHNPLYFFGSCRGFMLLAYEHTGDVIVWNPTTGSDLQFEHLEAEILFKYLCGFGYDSSTDDYFVVVITLYRSFLPQTEIHSFSMKSESWCDPKYVNVHYMAYGPHSSTIPGVFLNDSLHWLVTYMDTRLPVVLCYDLREKSLSEIPLPSELAAELTRKVYYLRVLGGCLSLCSSGGGGMRDAAEIWAMKEYKVQSSWTKTFVITSCHIPCRHFYPICFIEGGGVVGNDGNGTLLKFSSKGKLLEHRKYDQEYKKDTKYFEMYTESLLSVPGEQPPFLYAKSLPGEQPPLVCAKSVTGEQPPILCANSLPGEQSSTSLPGGIKEATEDGEEEETDEDGEEDETDEDGEEEETDEDEEEEEIDEDDEFATEDGEEEDSDEDEEEEETDDEDEEW